MLGFVAIQGALLCCFWKICQVGGSLEEEESWEECYTSSTVVVMDRKE